MTTAHHFNDMLPVKMSVVTTSDPSSIVVRSGLGTPLPVITTTTSQSSPTTQPTATEAAAASVTLHLEAVALPQYVILPADATATAACASLKW
jgi:hypothetical protein